MEWKNRLKQIQLVVLDVDGTMTDGGMYYTSEGDVMKRFHVHDGMGINLLRYAGIEIAIMTADPSPIVAARAKKLKIEHVLLGCKAKRSALEALSTRLCIPLDRIAYMGNDINDEAAMRISGIKACPSNAVRIIRDIADYICTASGGHGAIREFAELILEAQGLPNTLPEDWSKEPIYSSAALQ